MFRNTKISLAHFLMVALFFSNLPVGNAAGGLGAPSDLKMTIVGTAGLVQWKRNALDAKFHSVEREILHYDDFGCHQMDPDSLNENAAAECLPEREIFWLDGNASEFLDTRISDGALIRYRISACLQKHWQYCQYTDFTTQIPILSTYSLAGKVVRKSDFQSLPNAVLKVSYNGLYAKACYPNCTPPDDNYSGDDDYNDDEDDYDNRKNHIERENQRKPIGNRKFLLETTTDANGLYQVSDLQPGFYHIEVYVDGNLVGSGGFNLRSNRVRAHILTN